MSSLTILLRILVAAFCGGLIGMEREIHGCVAGLRTHILVCTGSALFMITSLLVAVKYGHVGVFDPSRIAAGVVTGIGFLGAGAIIRYGASVRGLTTAASIWAVAAIGLAVGAGIYEAAGIATVVCLSILFLSRLEGRMGLKKHVEKLSVSLRTDAGTGAGDIKSIIKAYGGRIKRVSSEVDESENMMDLVFDLIIPRVYHKDIISEISSLPGVDNVCWR